tara:strand:- start:224 stop:688 length:465 start_codon:yes stop_codon:yes gene_type:complete
MSSELRVDRIIPTAGVPTGGAGGVIQVVMGESDTQTDTTSTSYVDSNLSATITPKFATSKILIHLMTTVQQSGSRTRVTIHSSASGGTLHGSSNGLQAFEGNNVNMGCHLTILDSPNTTSAVTYKLQYLNQGGDTSFCQCAVHKGTITLMEVSA